MASPQLENGYMSIANEIWDALIRIRIPGEARQILDLIIRKTYGYHKTEDRIALSQFVEATGISKVHVLRALEKLNIMGLITVTQKGNDFIKTFRFNKDFEKWKPLPKKVTVKALPKKETRVTQKGNESLPKKVPTKDSKETITKETPIPPKGAGRALYLSPELRNVVIYLNMKAGRHFNPDTKGFAKHVNGRFKEKATADLMQKVVDYKVWDWQNRYKDKTTGQIHIPEDKKDMREYLTPDTLFNSTKFWKYADQAISFEMEQKKKEELRRKYANSGLAEEAKRDKVREEAWSETHVKIERLRAQYGRMWYLHYNDPEKRSSPDVD